LEQSIQLGTKFFIYIIILKVGEVIRIKFLDVGPSNKQVSFQQQPFYPSIQEILRKFEDTKEIGIPLRYLPYPHVPSKRR